MQELRPERESVGRLEEFSSTVSKRALPLSGSHRHRGPDSDQSGHARPQRAERVIAAGRLVLAAFFVIAVLLDPAPPPAATSLLPMLALLYFAYAGTVGMFAALGRTWPASLPVTTHVADLVLFSIFVYLSRGSMSPFFLYFIFATICGALRWNGRGALLTGTAALLAYVAVTMAAPPSPSARDFEHGRFITRCAQLGLITLMLTYLGIYQRRLQTEIASLAAWPRRLPADGATGLEEVLAHSAAILRVPRVILVWHEEHEPSLRVAVYARDRLRLSYERPYIFGTLVPSRLERSSFFCEDASAESFVVQRVPGGFATWRGRALSADFCSSYDVSSALALRIVADRIDGHLFALDRRNVSVDDLLLGDVVGRFVASALEQQMLIAQLRESAACEERVRLARELHDGLLQSLTAVALQAGRVRDVLAQDPQRARERLAELEETILMEQRSLRAVVDALQPGRNVHAAEDSATRLGTTISAAARQWNVSVQMKLSSTVPPLPTSLTHELCRMAQEAVANAVRHGGATNVAIDYAAAGDRVRLVLGYQGRGFPSFQGRHDLASLNAMQLGPRTLKGRVAELKGNLVIESDESGARVEIEVPAPPPAPRQC